MALVNPHPALKAVSAACMGDAGWATIVISQRAFRLSYGYDIRGGMEQPGKLQVEVSTEMIITTGISTWGRFSNINKDYLHGKIPSWNSFVEHPSYDDSGRRKRLVHALHQATVPNLNVAGGGTRRFYGPMDVCESGKK